MKRAIQLLLTAWLLLQPTLSVLSQENDSISQCVTGFELFRSGKSDEALPLLEAGFAGRKNAVFPDPDNLGFCALALGLLRHGRNDSDGALEAYAVAQELFLQTGNRKGEGLTLNNIGGVYDSQSQYEEALINYEKALAVYRGAGDSFVVGEGQTLNNVAQTYRSQGRYIEALIRYEEALAIYRRLGDRAGEGDVLNGIGTIYHSQGQYEEALTKYEAALAISREADDWADKGSILNNIATVYVAQGRYEEALAKYEEILVIRRTVGDRAGEGKTFNGIGTTYYSQGRYVEALTKYEEALFIHQETGDQANVAVTLNNIGAVYKSQGRYADALTRYGEALTIFREMKNRTDEGATLNNIGQVYQLQGRHEEALTYFKEALSIHREVSNRAGEGTVLNNIAYSYYLQGQYEEALTRYVQALAIDQEIGSRAEEGTALNNIGLVYESQGRYEEALTKYEKALAIDREIGYKAGEGATLGNMAAVYHRQEKYEEALIRHEEALAIFRKTGKRAVEGTTLYGIGSVYYSQGWYEESLIRYEEALAIAREVGDRAGEGIILLGIALVYQSQERYEDALARFEDALAKVREVGDRTGEGITLANIGNVYQAQEQNLEAIRYYEQATTVFESVRATSGNDAARASFIAQYTSVYHRLLDLYIEENMLPEAFYISEQGRARSFGDALATGSVQLSDNEAAPLIAAELSSYNAVVAAQDALARANALNPPDPELVANLTIQLETAQTDHDNARSAIESRGDQLTALIPSRKAVIALPETQALLDDQTTLVSFWVLEERTIAFILTNDSFDAVAIDIDEETLNRQIKAFHDALNDRFAENAAYPDTAVHLYNSLIAPLRSRLNTFHLVIVPHQGLHYLPFAALTDGERSLMDDFNITYLPNAGMLQFLPDGAETASLDDILVLGDPTTELGALPGAAQEAQTIAALFGVEPYLGDAATEAIIRQEVAAVDILHLGAHASYNNAAPLDSTIHLAAGDDSIAEEDGKLHAREVYGLPLQETELVVLSACQTNIGNLDVERSDGVSNVSAGDEIVSLNRAFLFYAPTVISTLWTVDDDAASLLMERFYTHLLDGKSRADALRLAQLYVRDFGNGEYADPYNWAGFVLSGDGGAIESSAPPTANTEVDTTTVISDTETAVPQANESPISGGNSIYLGVVLLLALVALVIVARRNLISGRDKKV